MSGFGALLKNLRDVEGAKSMIILSQGLMLEGSQAEASALATLAAEARVNVNVLMFAQVEGNASQSRISETLSQDRDLREAGLETLAVAIARIALSRRGQPAVHLRSAAERDLGALHARRRAGRAGPRRASRIRFACRSAARACRCARDGRCSTPYGRRTLVARRGDGARAAIAGRQHRAADAAVDLYVPRCRARTK